MVAVVAVAATTSGGASQRLFCVGCPRAAAECDQMSSYPLLPLAAAGADVICSFLEMVLLSLLLSLYYHLLFLQHLSHRSAVEVVTLVPVVATVSLQPLSESPHHPAAAAAVPSTTRPHHPSDRPCHRGRYLWV